MGFEEIQQFCSIPELPDIVAYVLIIVSFIFQFFVKQFVKKDNSTTSFQINEKVTKLLKLQDELNISTQRQHNDMDSFYKEKNKMLQEINLLKNAIKVLLVNNQELVKNGVANEVIKMLHLDEEDIITEIKVTDKGVNTENKREDQNE